MNNNGISITFYKIIAWGVFGAFVGAVIYFWGALSSPESRTFFQTPEFIIWFLINEALFALYPILWVFVIKPKNRLKELPTKRIFEIIGSSILLLGLFISLPLVGARIINMQPLPFAYADQKILVLEGIGFFAAALPISVSIWLTQAAVDAALGESAPERDIQKYIELRSELHRYLTILSVLLSLFILAGAALRGAAIATGTVIEERYPPIYLLLLGAYYTCLVALVYFPAQQTLATAGYRLLEACFPLPALNTTTWSTAYSNRKELEELLELKVSFEQRLVTSIALLAPFISSIFSLLVEQ